MSRRKKKFTSHGGKLEEIKNFVTNYQYSLRALISSLPDRYDILDHTDIVALGYAEIWKCLDGVVVLIYKRNTPSIKTVVKDAGDLSIEDFLLKHPTAALYNEQGDKFPASLDLEFDRFGPDAVLWVATLMAVGENHIFRTLYQNSIIMKWTGKLPEPDGQALENFRAVFAIRNVGGSETLELPQAEREQVFARKSAELTEEFRKLLDSAESEEGLQIFLSEHPEFLYPDYVRCYPKLRLGSEFVTDFVFLVQSQEGLKYVFVEIESSSKNIFTKKGEFSAQFTQAKSQLLDWDIWITKHITYASEQLPGLFKPKFHLVMGRSTGINDKNREKIAAEAANTAIVLSTYDDLLGRFQQIISRLSY